MSSLISLILFIWVGAITPGPVNLLTMSSSMNCGWRRTLPFVLGASIAYSVVVFVMSSFFNQLLGASEQLRSATSWVCAGYLLYIAYRIANSVIQSSAIKNPSYRPTFTTGALMQFLNPKAWLFASSSFGLFLSGQPNVTFQTLSIFCILALLICFMGVSSWMFAGHCLKKLPLGPSQIKMVNLGLALLLCISVIPITFSQP